jgi:hypothetical protein
MSLRLNLKPPKLSQQLALFSIQERTIHVAYFFTQSCIFWPHRHRYRLHCVRYAFFGKPAGAGTLPPVHDTAIVYSASGLIGFNCRRA